MTVMDIGEGKFIVARKPNQRSDHDVGVNNFLPCPFCGGFYRRQELWKHTASCKVKSSVEGQSSTMQKHIQVNSKLILLGGLKGSNTMLNNVLATMRDELTAVVKSDEVILGVGKLLVEKHGVTNAQDTTQTMRELARLLIQLRRMEKNPHTQLSNFIVPNVCDFAVRDGKQNVGTLLLVLKIGYGLKKCVNVIVGRALRNEDEMSERAADNFRRLLESEWSSRISHHSLTTLSTRRFNKINVLPLAEDLDKLRKYIDRVIKESMESLENHPTLEDWSLLATNVEGAKHQRFHLKPTKTDQTGAWSTALKLTKSLDKFEQELSKRQVPATYFRCCM